MANPKLAQVLQLTPANEIVFEGPFDNVVTSYLELKNPSDQRVCFKVKTTAPRRYCVRPNSGIVEPGSKVKIAIMLQPIEQESQSERSKHKFMVQSTFIKDETWHLDTVWQKATPEETMDSKLRCVFSAPNTPAPVSATTTTTTNTAPATADPTSTTSNTTSATQKPTLTAAPATNTSTQQSQVTNSQKYPLSSIDAGDEPSSNRSAPPASSTSTSRTSSASKNWASNVSSQQPKRSDMFDGDKSVASSHNLTASSFLQPISDDKKILLVSLVMLFIGVILGKYII